MGGRQRWQLLNPRQRERAWSLLPMRAVQRFSLHLPAPAEQWRLLGSRDGPWSAETLVPESQEFDKCLREAGPRHCHSTALPSDCSELPQWSRHVQNAALSVLTSCSMCGIHYGFFSSGCAHQNH